MVWHDYIAVCLVIAAAAYVGYRAWRAVFGGAASGCSTGCGSCSHAANSKTTQLLTIDASRTSAGHK
jgi:hypothetical protein